MIWIARGLLAATVFAVPAAGAHERVAHRRALSAGMLVTITSAAHGPIGAGACGGTDLRVTNFPTANAIELMGFDETTSTTAPAGSGTFELQFPSICLASFIRALATNEVLTVNLAYLETVPSGNVNGTATMILALANARMTHVNIAWDVEGRVILAVGLASLNVTASTPGAAPVASAGSGTSSAKPAGSATSGAIATGAVQSQVRAASPAVLAAGGLATRVRVPSVHLTGTQLTAFKTANSAGSGASWPSRNGSVRLKLMSDLESVGAHPVTATFQLQTMSLGAAYTVGANGMPNGPLQITLQPLTKTQDANTVALKSAAIAHAPLSRATISVVDATGAPGITISFKNSQLLGDVVNGASSETISETLTLSLGQATVWDIISGVTAGVP